MAENTSIEWCDSTFNPWIGCTRVGPGCDHCYAAVSTPARTQGIEWGPHAERRRTADSTWKQPLAWERQHESFYAQHGRRRRVFCASLADVFDNAVPVDWRLDLFKLIAATPHLDWLLVTKRIGNAAGMLDDAMLDLSCGSFGWTAEAALPNVWIGVTVVNQAEVDRDVPRLLALPAAVRFLSVEPMLGPIDLQVIDIDGHSEIYPLRGTSDCEDGDGNAAPDLPQIDWVICGGESGPRARPIHPAWARGLRDQCEAAGTKFLFKQWGEWLPAGQDGAPDREEQEINASDVPLRVGKAAAGRLLDGRTHDEFPEVPHA